MFRMVLISALLLPASLGFAHTELSKSSQYTICHSGTVSCGTSCCVNPPGCCDEAAGTCCTSQFTLKLKKIDDVALLPAGKYKCPVGVPLRLHDNAFECKEARTKEAKK